MIAAERRAAREYAAMLRCLELAELGRATVWPNPMVGCVVLRDGAALAEGWHVGPGRDHAEVDALRKLDLRAPGATLVVNLEPCCHFGRTPPCVDAVLAAGVARVVVAMVDPNPLVAGGGLRKLRDRGVEVEVGVAEAQARALNHAFVEWVAQGGARP